MDEELIGFEDAEEEQEKEQEEDAEEEQEQEVVDYKALYEAAMKKRADIGVAPVGVVKIDPFIAGFKGGF